MQHSIEPALKATHPRVFFALLVALLILLQCMSAGYTVISKGAYNTGLSPVILCLYRDCAGAPCVEIVGGIHVAHQLTPFILTHPQFHARSQSHSCTSL